MTGSESEKRIAVLILGLLLGLLMFLQMLFAAAAGGLSHNPDIQTAASLAFVASLLWLIGAAFVLGFPLISVVAFLLAACCSLGAVTAWSAYKDQGVWAVVAVILAIMSFFGWRGKVKQRRAAEAERLRQAQRDEQLAELMRRKATSG